MKKRFTEGQIVGLLLDADAGIPVKDLCRKHGFSEGSYYLWRSKFGGRDLREHGPLRVLSAKDHAAFVPSVCDRPLRSATMLRFLLRAAES